MQPKGLDLVLWVVGFLEHVALLLVLWHTRRQKNFPVFTSLISVNIFKTITLFTLLHHAGKLAYFYGYWSFAVVDSVLQMLVIGEAAIHVFRPLRTWAPGSQTSMIVLLTIGSILSVFITWLASPKTQLIRQFVVIKGNLFSSILVGELLVGLIVLAATSGLPLRTDAARIVEGFGVFSLLSVVIQGLQAHFGLANAGSTFVLLSRVGIVSYMSCLAYWIFAFRKIAVAPRELPDKMREQLLSLNDRVAAELRNLQSLGR